MTTDILTILYGTIGFLVFILIQMLSIRLSYENKIISVIVTSYVLAGIMTALTGYLLFGITVPQAILSFVVYNLFCFFYVQAILGIAFSSVRIQLLKVVRDAGEKGISLDEILKKYNRRIIIENRLKRLTESDVVSNNDGYYSIKSANSPFFLHAIWLRFVQRIYNG
jgi:hypothetical protein